MLTLADIFVRYRDEYLRKYGAQLLPSHRRTMTDIIACRTQALGGSLYRCPSCKRKHYSYHSCGNRHCPRCGHDDATEWARSCSALIPRVPCFLITATVPDGLNELIRSHQKALYGLIFSASAAAIKKLCADPRHLGAEPGMLGVLHTWARDMGYHPHVHYVVPAGGFDARGHWVPTHYRGFLVPVKALSPIFRAKFRDGLKKLGLYDQVPPEVWKKDWVIHCEPAGDGPQVIRYLARYIFRVALSNSRIVALKGDQVTFRYQPVGTKLWKSMTLPVLVFMARFLQHVLPRGFAKVRYFGFLHPRCRHKLAAIRSQLRFPAPPSAQPDADPAPLRCPHCDTPLLLLQNLPRLRRPP